MRRNLPCDLGRAVGANLARLTEPSIARLAAEGETDERCSTCAFRAGTLPNGCLETVADAMKCAMEGDPPFLCHDRRKVGQPCHGWYAARVALKGATTQVPWRFSNEYGATTEAQG